MKIAKILVVDDERSVRQALTFELQDEGYEVHYASDSEEALSIIRAFDIDMVITDVYLGRNQDGIQLMDQMSRINKSLTFIVISAFPESDLSIRAKEILNDRFYEKPFLMPDLKRKVNQLLMPNRAAFAVS